MYMYTKPARQPWLKHKNYQLKFQMRLFLLLCIESLYEKHLINRYNKQVSSF